MSQFKETLSLTDEKRVQVLVPRPFSRTYDYAVPEGVQVNVGDYVRVPFGKDEIIAVVWGVGADDDGFDPAKLKLISKKFDFPPMREAQRKFVEWVSKYSMYELGSILKMCLTGDAALEPPKRARLTEAPCQMEKVIDNTLTFSDSQQESITSLVQSVKDNKYSTTLLDGVTGSGKTEVYFEAVAEAIEQGKQALVLLPEIFLSAQFLERFERRFGIEPAVWHSEVTPARKRLAWSGVAKGETKVVVGARSALFLPYANLGLIVVDEEHETSYKQEEGVLYNAHDMAIVRAHLEDAPIILASATPSIETMYNVKEGKYKYLNLPSRHAGAKMPDVHIVDMKKNRPSRGKYLSPVIEQELIKNFEKKDQSLLFLNRRGYAPLTLCRTCGFRFQCPSCSAWLVEHRKGHRLQCHHCGYKCNIPNKCPECETEDNMAACGPGVERIEEEVNALLPDANTVILASDLVTSPKMVAEAVHNIEDHSVDVIIGTQIIAKGNHFPDLTFVGVVDADLGMEGGDLRAGERTFQLLHQVAGRAGRAKKEGRVYVQTYMPDQAVIKALAANNRDQFLDIEMHERESALMPPYGRLAAIILSARNEGKLDAFCQELAQAAPRFDNVSVLGPAPAPMAYLRGKHRRRFLVKTPKSVKIQKIIEEWLDKVKAHGSIKLKVDIDPQSFF